MKTWLKMTIPQDVEVAGNAAPSAMPATDLLKLTDRQLKQSWTRRIAGVSSRRSG